MNITSKERVLKVFKGEIPDRVPVIPIVDGYHAPKIINEDSDKCFLNDMLMAKALLTSLKHYDYDGIIAEIGPGDTPYKSFGCEVKYSKDSVPIVIDNLIKSKEDISKIKIPDPWSGNKMNPVKFIVKEVGNKKFVLANIKSPFEYAFILRGSFNFMEDLYNDPSFVKELMETTKKISFEIGNALIEAGVDALVIKDSVASSSLISPKYYEEFAFPYEKELIQKFNKKIPLILHICRNSSPIIKKMAETKAQALEIDSPEIDSFARLNSAKKEVGDKIVLKGNINAVEIIERGNFNLIKKTVKDCMNAAKENGRYILSTGDSIPRNASLSNVKDLVELAKKYGIY